MYIYGTGGIAIVAYELFVEQNIKISGFLDDDLEKKEFLGFTVKRVEELRDSSIDVLVGIGDNRIRKMLCEKVNLHADKISHSTVLESPSAKVGAGSLLFHDVCIQAGAILGRSVIANTGASIDHDCKIGDFCHIAPRVTLCGGVEIGEGANIGANTVVIPNIKIGKWATIGAGAVVIRDVPEYATVVGNPGRILSTESKFKGS